MNLEEIREKIDTLDRELTALLVKRMEITKEVAAYKQQHDLPIYHPKREQEVLEKVSGLCGEEYRHAVTAIYQCIMDESKGVQEEWLAQFAENADDTQTK